MNNNLSFLKIKFILFLLLITNKLFSFNLDSLEYQLKIETNDTIRYKTMLYVAQINLYNNPKIALHYAEKALAETKFKKNKKGEGSSYDMLGIINTVIGNYKAANLNYQSAIEIFKEINDLPALTKAYSNLSILYQQSEDFEKAIESQIKAIKIFEQNGDTIGIAKSYNHLGNINFNLGNYKKAKQNFFKALEYIIGTNDYNTKGIIISNIGLVYSNEEKYDSARFYFNKSLKIGEEINSEFIISNNLNYIGNIHFYKNDFETSKKLHLQTLPFYENNNLGYLAIVQFTYLVRDYTSLSQSDSAHYYLNKIINSPNNYKIPLLEAYTEMAKLYINRNESDSALHYFTKVIKTKDELFELKKTEIIELLEAEFEYENKEKEIDLLKEKDKMNQLEINTKESEVREQKYLVIILLLVLISLIIGFWLYRKSQLLRQEKIKLKLEQQVFRAQMNPHFIFNALNSIQRMYIEGNLDKASSFMSNFAELMRKILENSSHYTISLNEEVKTLGYYMDLEKLRCQDKFTYNIKIDPTIDLHTTNVPPLIIQPFVENAIWHGILPKEGKGHISITISQEKNRIKFEIHDNGIGINNTKQNHHKSKGINITEQRIGSKVNIESIENEKTSVTFYLKMAL